MTDLPSLKVMGHRRLNARINVGQGPPGAKTCLRGANAITLANSLRFFEGMLSHCGQATFDRHQCRERFKMLKCPRRKKRNSYLKCCFGWDSFLSCSHGWFGTSGLRWKW